MTGKESSPTQPLNEDHNDTSPVWPMSESIADGGYYWKTPHLIDGRFLPDREETAEAFRKIEERLEADNTYEGTE